MVLGLPLDEFSEGNMYKAHDATGIRRIFHPSDFSEASNGAFAYALKLALAVRGHLTILHTGETRKDSSWAEFPRVRRTLERWKLLPKGSVVEDIASLGLDVRKVVMPSSDPARSIVRYLHTHPHDLIVLATHQHEGLKRWIHEPVAEPIARSSATLTLFVPQNTRGFVSAADGTTNLRNILIPVDSTPDPQTSVYAAAAIAEALGCQNAVATLLHVSDSGCFPQCTPATNPALEWRRAFRQGLVEAEILKTAEENQAELIVMGTEGHKGWLDALRGSTTENIVRHSRCPVLAVPSYLAAERVVSTVEDLATGRLAVSL